MFLSFQLFLSQYTGYVSNQTFLSIEIGDNKSLQ